MSNTHPAELTPNDSFIRSRFEKLSERARRAVPALAASALLLSGCASPAESVADPVEQPTTTEAPASPAASVVPSQTETAEPSYTETATDPKVEADKSTVEELVLVPNDYTLQVFAENDIPYIGDTLTKLKMLDGRPVFSITYGDAGDEFEVIAPIATPDDEPKYIAEALMKQHLAMQASLNSPVPAIFEFTDDKLTRDDFWTSDYVDFQFGRIRDRKSPDGPTVADACDLDSIEIDSVETPEDNRIGFHYTCDGFDTLLSNAEEMENEDVEISYDVRTTKSLPDDMANWFRAAGVSEVVNINSIVGR